jgi:Glycogen recognition site of AMP-activated protein kinase
LNHPEDGVYQFQWHHGGKQVFVEGSFSNGIAIAMKPSIVKPGSFYLDYSFPQGPFEFMYYLA